MSVYVDKLQECLTNPNWPYTRSCHLMADSLVELIFFGKQIGLSLGWIQHRTAGLLHFDLNVTMREKAVKAGAIEIDRKQVVELIRKRRASE